jgi:hypothetical protein
MIKKFSYAFGRDRKIFLNAATCDSINDCPQIDNSGDEILGYIKDYYSYRDAAVKKISAITYYAKNPLKAGFYSLTLPTTIDRWDDDFINEKPLTSPALTDKMQSQFGIDFLSCPTTPSEPLTPAHKQLIQDVCGGGDLLSVRRKLSKEYPAEDLGRYTWQDICVALRQTAQNAAQSKNADQGDPERSRSDEEPQKARKGTRATPAEMEVRNRKVEAFVLGFVKKKTDYPKLKDIEEGTPYTNRQIRQTPFYIQNKDRFNAKVKPKSIVYQDTI